MNSTAGLLIVILLAVLVGALIPVLYQLVQTLKSTKQFLDQTGRRLDEALREFTDTTARINRIAATIENESRRLQPALDAVASVGGTIHRAREAVQSASAAVGALAPAFFAGLRAFFERGDGRESESDAGQEEPRSRPDGPETGRG